MFERRFALQWCDDPFSVEDSSEALPACSFFPYSLFLIHSGTFLFPAGGDSAALRRENLGGCLAGLHSHGFPLTNRVWESGFAGNQG